MSGSTGGNRIKKEDVKFTIDSYIENILSKYPGYLGKYAISGSYNVGTKSDYGDIDLIVLMKGKDKTESKKDFVNWLLSNFGNKPELLMPFISDKYKNKLYMNSGELISIHYPQFGKEYGCQIDNMFALSEDEFYFKQNFLNMPAEIQGLVLGLVKTVLIEEDVTKVFNRLDIKENVNLSKGFEYEFNLSGTELGLRLVELDKDYKQLSRTTVWSSDNWESLKILLKNYNLDLGFKDLLNTIKFKNKRSSNRILGIFKSMISVKSGKLGTEKGFGKIRAIKEVEKKFEK